MRALLGTHSLIWALSDPVRLPPEAHHTVADGRNGVIFSAVSIWEIATKVRLGRRGCRFAPDIVLSAAKARGAMAFVELAIDAGVELLTSDAALPAYSPLVRLA